MTQEGEARYLELLSTARARASGRTARLDGALPKARERRITDEERDASVALLKPLMPELDAMTLARTIPHEGIACAVAMFPTDGKPVGNPAGWIRACVTERWWQLNRKNAAT